MFQDLCPSFKSHINMCLLKEKFPTLQKQVAVVTVFDKGNCATYWPITISNNFSEIVENIIHNQISFIWNVNFNHLSMVLLKKIYCNQFTYFNSVKISVISWGLTNSIYFVLSQAFDKVPHTLLLHKHNNFLLLERYITTFQS
jgi:hypothetical protein